MHRRTFIATTVAGLALATTARAATGTVYTPGLVDQLLAEGKTVFVDFYTDWCTTCRAQGRVIEGLLSANPDYQANIAFVRVDWDIFADDALSRRLEIPRRSTLVALHGDKELGRVVAGTTEAEIKGLLDAALHASMM